MKRRPGMSVSEFREYYETKHRLIGEKYLTGYATRYLRRFTNPNMDRDGQLRDPEYDVFLEIWYPDQATYEACGKALSAPEVAKEIKEGIIIAFCNFEGKVGVAVGITSKLINKYDAEFPSKYFPDFLEYISMSEEEFTLIIDAHRSPHIWKQTSEGWKLRHTVSKDGEDD